MPDDDEPPRRRDSGDLRPIPDPSILTTEQLLRVVASEREYVDGQIEVVKETLAGMERATDLRIETMRIVPDMMDEKINHVRELAAERFRSIDQQFIERDTRSARERRDNQAAVDAAFAAQKEASAQQTQSSTLAIAKSEAATVEAINKLGQLAETNNANLANQIAALSAAMSAQISDIKERVSRIESIKQGGQNAYAAIAASVAFIAVVIGIVATIVAVTRGGG